MPLAYLSGIVPFHRYWQCLNIENDLCYFGIRSYEEEEVALIEKKGVLVFEPDDCDVNNFYGISRSIRNHFDNDDQFWFSFDIDGLDGSEFKSTGTIEGNGVSLDFAAELFKQYMPRTIGMDFTEVNFELTNGQTR